MADTTTKAAVNVLIRMLLGEASDALRPSEILSATNALRSLDLGANAAALRPRCSCNERWALSTKSCDAAI